MSQLSSFPSARIDLTAYLQRIRYEGELRPTLAVLQALHLAHAIHVPFENLDLHLGPASRAIRIDPEHVERKLVHGGRGGYCYEQNTLFGTAAAQLGFRVTPLAAHVARSDGTLAPRSHMLLRIDLPEGAYLADVGFGGVGPLQPVPMFTGEVSEQFAWAYRVARDGERRLLQARRAGRWEDKYTFSLEPELPIDLEVGNHFTSTHPASWFVQNLLVQRNGRERRLSLQGLGAMKLQCGGREHHFNGCRTTLCELYPDHTAERVIEGDEAISEVLRTRFGIQMPPGTRFRSGYPIRMSADPPPKASA